MNPDPGFIEVEGICEQCGEPFRYKKRRSRRKICDPCGASNKKASTQVSKKLRRQRLGIKKTATEDKYQTFSEGGITKMTQAEIAKKLRISKSTVEETERVVLRKIRNNPELKELWLRVKEEGFPLASGAFPVTDEGKRLLDYQLSVVDFYDVYDKIVDAGCTGDATECLKEIAKFQAKIAKTLNKLDVTSHDHSQ